MVNASLTTLSSYRKCSKRRILDRSAQTTSLPPIEDTMKCSRIARGFAFGSSTGFAAEVKPKAGLGVKASAAFTVCEREFHALKFSALAAHFFTNQTQGRVYLSCERQPENGWVELQVCGGDESLDSIPVVASKHNRQS